MLAAAAGALSVIGLIISLTLYSRDDPRAQLWLRVSIWGFIVFVAVRVLDAYVLVLAHG